ASEALQLNLLPERQIVISGKPEEVILKIDLRTSPRKQTRRRSVLNLALVLDRSGSMAGAKLEKAKQAASELIDQLSENDTLSVVTYSSTVEVLFPSQKLTDK